MRHDAWHLVPDSVTPDKRRARVACDACGIEVDRIHPYVQPVAQVEHTAATRRAR